MPRRKQSQKRQTRLGFTPLPSSSPSARKYPEELQSRLANVRCETPSKSRKKMEQAEPKTPAEAGGEAPSDPILLDSSQDTDLVPDMPSSVQTVHVETSLPTPVPSSQQKEQGIDQDEDLATTDSPIPVVGVQDTDLDLEMPPSVQTDQDESALPTPIASSHKKDQEVDHDGDLTAVDSPITVVDVAPGPTTPVKTHGPDTAGSDEDVIVTSDEDVTVPRFQSRRVMAILDSDSDDEPDIKVPIRRSTRRKDVQHSSPVQVSRDVRVGSSSGRQTRSTAKQTRKKSLRSLKKTPTLQRPRGIQNPVASDIGEAESSDDEDLTVRGIRPKPNQVHELGQLSSDEEGLPISEDTEDSEDIETSPAKRRKITPRKHQSVSPEKCVSNSPRKHSRPNSRQEKEDLDEDLADLEDTPVKETRTRKQTMNVKNQARYDALKKIKRKQRELAGEEVSEDEPDSDGEEDPESDNVSQSRPYQGNLDKYEEAFIDDPPEGAFEHHDLPIEFSGLRSKPAKELFKHVVEWFVHNKLNPAFDRHDTLYRLAFDKLNSEAEGLAGQGTSSAWGPHPNGIKFTKALKGRPEIRIENYNNRVMRKDCDACNRSNHPASFAMSFAGPLYNKDTLEPEEEDTSIGEDTGFQEDIPGPEVTFYIGSKCKANAEKVHNLTHWRYRVNDWILDWLKETGKLDDEQIVERSKWSKNKLEKSANQIVGAMEKNGEIEKLYRDLRDSINEARAQQPNRFTNDY